MQQFELKISSLNVNSLNVSTMGLKTAKIFTKIEGATGKKRDVIFLSDCRMSNKGKEVERLFRLSRNGSYKLYYNRGVAIAIRSDIFHVVHEITRDVDENYIFMKLKIKEKELLLGCIYGPNKNDINFFRDIRKICDEFNGEFIIGGDFNTVLDESEGENSIDRVGVGHCPNILNSKEINKWMREQNVIDPFRLLYPEKVEFSYTSFRRNSAR